MTTKKIEPIHILVCLKKKCTNLITTDEAQTSVCNICGHKVIKDGKLSMKTEDLPSDEDYEKYKDLIINL
jgi:hypothetical protein